MSAAWQAVYRNFDDDALAALASAGLLRRAAKDVEAGKVGWDGPGGATQGLVLADGQHVRLGAQGPAHAGCDCPAPGVCKHIIAAALWLREAGADGAVQSGAAAPADALAEVLALDGAALFKAAGRAAVRRAADLFATLGEVKLVTQGATLAIELAQLGFTCRYVAGAGFDGMVSDLAPRSRKALHLLALVAARHAHGRPADWPHMDAGAPGAGPDAPDADERALLAQVRAAVLEVSASGWSHVSDVTAPQLRALATSARVDAFPRLAGLLRALAGTADLLARRDFGADERQAMRLAAQVFALAHALGHAHGDAASRLRGAERRSFSDNVDLELLPLGAHWWEQRSGARGLTVSLWDPAGQRVLQCVQARRDAGDPGFTREAAWSLLAPWQGAGAPASLAGSALVLSGPRLSHDGRLAIAGATRAQLLPRWRTADPRWQGAGFDDWSRLAACVRAGAGLLGEPPDTVLLRPSRCGAPQLDEIGQVLCWVVHDRHGAPLVLRMPYEAWKRPRFDNLEAWARPGVTIDAIVARLDRSLQGGLLEPVALLVERDGTPCSVALDFAQQRPVPDASLAARLGRMLKGRAAPAAAHPPAPHLGAVDALLSLLENKAMTGHLHLAGREDELHAVHHRLLGLGLDALATPLARYLARPDGAQAMALLHIAHTCLELDTAFLQR